MRVADLAGRQEGMVSTEQLVGLGIGRSGNLPRPRVNAVVEGHEVDFYWPTHNLIVETDGAATHLTATAFERDRHRDAQLTAAGHRVIRITWRQLTERPHEVARLLKRLLAVS